MAIQTLFLPQALPRDVPFRKLGLGARYDQYGLGAGQRFVSDIQNAFAATPLYNLPTIESVRIHYGGPLTDTQVQQSFGPTINPFGANPSSPPAGAISVESTMAEPGKLQTWALIIAIGWHLEPEPLNFTAKCNAWTTPGTGTVKPVSPDMFSAADLAISGPLGLTTGTSLAMADLEWGWWVEKAFYHMVRAYNLRWQWGSRTNIVNDSLRFTAYTPDNTQNGSSSSAEVDVNYFARLVNNYYRAQFAGGETQPATLLTIDRTRIGNMTLGGTAGLSVFRPTRNYETVGANFGGMGLRSLLRGNSEWRKLTTPFLMKPGVPIGISAQLSGNNGSPDDYGLMQAYLSASYGLSGGVVPAFFSEDINVNTGNGVTGTTTIGAEPSLDNPVAPQGITLPTGRAIFKGGTFKITVALKGFELTDYQAGMLSDPNVQALLQSQCGCQGAGS